MSQVTTGGGNQVKPGGRAFAIWSGAWGRIREMIWRAYLGQNSGALILVIVVIILIFEIILRDTGYLSWDNFQGIAQQTAAVTIMAVPTVFVISSGEIDPS